MFKYGGPIKEGIMDGMREPLKNGGLSKQFNSLPKFTEQSANTKSCT